MKDTEAKVKEYVSQHPEERETGGYSPAEIARQIGVTRQYVQQLLSRDGLPILPQREAARRARAEHGRKTDELVAPYLYTDLTHEEIARRVNLKLRTVRASMLRQGVSRRDQRSKRIRDAILPHLGTGETQSSIAKQIGVGQTAVSAWERRHEHEREKTPRRQRRTPPQP